MTIQADITQRVLLALEQGTPPWRMPWKNGLPANLVSGRCYRGINVPLLAMAQHDSPWWITFNQIKRATGYVKEGRVWRWPFTQREDPVYGPRRGEHGTRIVFWKRNDRKRRPKDGEVAGEDGWVRTRSLLLRHYTVFNVAQCNLPDGLVPREEPIDWEPCEHAEHVIRRYVRENGPTFEHGGGRAYYNPKHDLVVVPPIGSYDPPDEYYSTAFHELAHSTGHESRLARDIGTPKPFGSEDYSEEELVAEITAAMMCAECGIETTLENSTAYIAGWAKRIKADERLIIRAAQKAQRAADCIVQREALHDEEAA